MCRFLAILLFLLGSALFGQGADAVAAPSTAQCDDISSLYVEQISASHRYNNTLHTTTTVCVIGHGIGVDRPYCIQRD